MRETDPRDREKVEALERSLRERGLGADTTPARTGTTESLDSTTSRDRPDSGSPSTALHTSFDLEDDAETVFAVMGGSVRKGRWEPPARINVYALMGGVQLDFRDADMLEGTTEVRCYTMWGGIDITVPPDIDVDVNGIGLLGGFSHLAHRSEQDDAPRLVIKGVALMAGVDVKVKELKTG